ncbi:clavaminate synthase family protein [uncultured Ilumatobacter sp.]|jgi:gamma-butyrobetaine dioxygenase|uniref:clavaminate synthase family protein n=1 Tax=Ilumatobacter sp. TaxID=1967498 RepID=UPI0030A373BF|tara:strand:+ start:101 stop:1315 length:1215 start_codon:yes stop_codon:yes gene_type:complete
MIEARPTPDFATYPWVPISIVDGVLPNVHVAWADGPDLDCYSLWLFENSRAIDPVTRESTVDPADLPEPSFLSAARRTDDGALELTWGDGVQSIVHPGWLRAVARQRHRPEAVPGPLTIWTTDMLDEPPTFDGAAVLDDTVVFGDWLRAIHAYGFARLRNTPADRAFLETLIQRIGPIRGSNFGNIFTVEARLDADSTANTGLNLGQHADLPTRETPPGFQFLHCVENTVAGGASRMTDGLAVVAELEANHSAEYEVLTTLNWVFANRAPDGDHRWIGPVIDHGQLGSQLTMRAFYPVRLAPDMSTADVPRAYDAMRILSRVAHDERFMLRSRFEPGDIIGFDNRRMLHGRDAFDPGAGSRVLTGCYVDRDDLLSRLRVLDRDALQSRPATRPATPPCNPPSNL